MKRHKSIPEAEGLYWYCKPSREPEPVKVFVSVNGLALKSFSGGTQTQMRDGEWLIGPVLPPE